MNIRRFNQVFKYGWIHSGQIAYSEDRGFIYRITIFYDILYCYLMYRMWSNQYVNEKFYILNNEERKLLGARFKKEGLRRDEWQLDFKSTRKFLIKYSNIKYELDSLREKRNIAYTEKYKAGKHLNVEYNVNISRQHYLNGSISIGNNVLLAKNVFIDYSGDIIIKDNVILTNGVIIETHHHPNHSDFRQSSDVVEASSLVIEEGAVIGSRAIILNSCNYIGKNARIGAGAVVTKDIPDNAIAVGVPAKVIRIIDGDI